MLPAHDWPFPLAREGWMGASRVLTLPPQSSSVNGEGAVRCPFRRAMTGPLIPQTWAHD